MNNSLSIFPKALAHMDARALAALLHDVGLDACNAVIRDGFWVTPAGLASELPRFVRALRDEGITVNFATAGYSAEQLVADPAPLDIMADNGIVDFRMGCFWLGGAGDLRAQLADARRQMETLAGLCERHGVRAVYQLHHGSLVSSASAAWRLVEGLPAAQVGIELDPGNQSFEGTENWAFAAGLLGEHLAAVGVKDTVLVRDSTRAADPDKGWRRGWVPIDEGVTNWREVWACLKRAAFRGPFVFMPFYDSDRPEVLISKLKREVEYLKQIVKSEGAA